MKQSSLYFALAAALVGVAPHAGAALVAKQLAGPPSEFAQMREAQPEASALISKSALLPISLTQNKQGLWQWQGQLPVETSNLRLAVFTGAAEDWQLSLRAPFSTRAQSFDTLAKDRVETLYGMDNNEYPADYYSFEGMAAGEYTFSVEAPSATQTEGFVLISSEGPERLRAYVTSNGARTGEVVNVVAHGVMLDQYAKKSAETTVASDMLSDAYLRITAPNGEIFTELMFDDGLHQDGVAGDGIFGGSFVATDVGQYNAQVVATGITANGAPLVRTTEHLVPVVADELRLAADFATSHVVNDSRMMVDLAIAGAREDAHYRVISEVWGRSNKNANEAVPVAWIGGMVDNNDGTLNVGLDARWISLANAQGPFELRNLRIEDPNDFVVLARADRLNLDITAMPAAATRAVAAIDNVMLMGEKPAQLDNTRAGSRLLLVHGYCSGNVWGQVAGQFSNASVFSDFNQNRSHDLFARLVGNYGANFNSFGIVAHSQGGAAAVHLYTYYFSGLDNAGPGRLIQSVGTPYQGTALAGNLAALGSIFGAGCGTNNDLTYNGSSAWLSGIPSWARGVTNYYTTSFTDRSFVYDYCHLATDLFLSDPDDGTTERSRGQLSGAVNRGHRTGWCHTSGMRDPAQYLDSNRNSTMSANAAR